MKAPFDMELFLAGVLSGAYATRRRHLRQAKTIQAAIFARWGVENPWCWRNKHLVWFLQSHIAFKEKTTKYYYLLTVRLIIKRLAKDWKIHPR